MLLDTSLENSLLNLKTVNYITTSSEYFDSICDSSSCFAIAGEAGGGEHDPEFDERKRQKVAAGGSTNARRFSR